MKKVYCLLSLIFTINLLSSVYADCNPCNNGIRCCKSDYEIGLDLLVWRPCVDDLNVCASMESEVIDEIYTINLTFQELCPSWEMGLRFWFRYPDLFCWCNMGLKASYTFLDYTNRGNGFRADENCILIPPEIPDEFFDDITLDSRYESIYHELDALLYFDCCCGDCHSLEPYFGLAFLYIEQKLNLDFTLTDVEFDSTANMSWRSEAGGVGLRFGMAYNYYYSKCLSYYAFGQGTILASKQEEKQRHQFRGDSDFDLNIDNKECWGCIPGFHLGTGMIYDFCVCDFELSFRIGYEFRKWFGLRKHRRFLAEDVQTDLNQINDNTRAVGIHGLNVGFGWCF